MSLAVAGLLLLGARVAWQAMYPMAPADFKGLLYIRDYATLLPAALCWYAALVRAPSSGPIDRLLSRLEAAVAWLRQRPALVLALACVVIAVVCVAVNVLVFRTRAQISDECAYLFQAKVFASGRLWADLPPASPRFFWASGMAVTQDKWFGGYWPGHSLALMVGVLLRAPFIVNPLLSGALVALTAWAGRRLVDRETGLLAGVLMLASPFALLQGSSYFSHVSSTLCMLPAVVWFLTADPSKGGRLALAGLCTGALVLFRPYSVVLLGAWVVVVWIWRVLHRGVTLGQAIRGAAWMAAGALPGALLLLAYNRILTGDPLLAPLQIAYSSAHTLQAIGIGGHMIKMSAINLGALSVVMLGVPLFSLVPAVVGFFARERGPSGPIAALAIVYVLGFAIYPFHGLSYGPRYYFELLPLLMIMSAVGLRALPSLLSRRFGVPAQRSVRCMIGLCAAGAVISLMGVLPMRLWVYHDRAAYFDIRGLVAQQLQPPAVVFITGWEHNKLAPALAGYQLNDVDFSLPVIFARDLGSRNPELLAAYPGRRAYVLDLDRRDVAPYGPNDRE